MPRPKHPDKKKHAKRPRPAPVVPLTEAERKSRAVEEFSKALMHLAEAERIADWREAPNACVHSAYYAMHHAAIAALLAAGGVGKAKDVPKSHEHVIEHYGRLVASEGERLEHTGRALSRARSDRNVADYDLSQGATADDAYETTAEARAMIDAVKERWGFDDSGPRSLA